MTSFKAFYVSIFSALVLLLISDAEQSVADSEACKFTTSQFQNMSFHSVELMRSDGSKVRIRPRIADDAFERTAGFQHICPEIISTSSILFVYKSPISVGFHMFNVHAELDIGFFDEFGSLKDLIRMTPQDYFDANSITYHTDEEFQYALETRAGFFAENGLQPGNTTLIYP